MAPKGLEVSVGRGICSVEKCTDRTRCVLSRDQRRCKCTVGFYGDQCEKNGQIKVMCGRNYIAIRVMEDFFKYYKVPLESLHLPNKSCRARKELVDGVSYYMSTIPKEKYLTCGGRPMETNFTHISYSLSLLTDPRVIGNIIRDPVIKIDYTCVFPYVRSVSLPFPVVPFSRCVNDNTVSFLNVSEGQSGRNGESSTIRYSFDMFRFTSEPNSFYLHCTVQLCEPDDFQSCKPICNSITKREAVRAEPMQGLLSYGPIRIEMPEPHQSNILMTVVLPVAGVWTVGFFLSILIVVAKAGSRRLTQAEQH
ncbi:hypothetical protein F2P81_007367 [Scophthalmus maximus]|uniref:EGF-like domain-containing protein n=1 Tax=Scophthalmus maximus TaxID=52904 RepID=A0A6A4T9I2_SCOMX|nr:hypothetical protein F2P81_007367 [Scophthalmus maximus]